MSTDKQCGFDVEDVLKKLNEIAKNIKGKGSSESSGKYKFNKPDDRKDSPQTVKKMGEHYKKIEEMKYHVGIYENIDDKDMTKGNKFFIRITEPNGSYMDIDYFEYKRISMDPNKNCYVFIEGCMERLVGLLTENDRKVAISIVEYLSYLYFFKDEYIKLYNNIGWDKYDGYNIFKYDVIYSPKGDINSAEEFNLKGECTNTVKDALYKEDGPENGDIIWAESLSCVMYNSVLASIIISASISGIFRQMLPYTKETNININIVGERAIGKSTIGHFALSFFGNPELLEGSFTDTENAMEIIRAERTVIPYVLDERMLRIEGVSESVKKRTVLIDIFREYEGKVKERMGKQYESTSGKRTNSPIISSSVESMLNMVLDYADLGQFRRFMEFKVDAKHPLFVDKKEAESVEEIAYTYYGYGVDILISYIFQKRWENGEEIIERFNKTNNEIEERIGVEEKEHNLKGIKALSKRFSLIILSYEILTEAMDDFLMGNTGEGFISDLKMRDKMIDALIENAIEKTEKIKTRISVRKNILNFVDKFKGLFHQGIKAWDGAGACLGGLEETKEEYKIYIRKNSFIWWVMASPMEYEKKDLEKYIKILIDNEYKGMERHAVKLAGDMPEKDFTKFFSRYKDEVEIEDKKTAKARFDVIIVSRKEFDATDKKDPEEEQ